MNKNIKDFFQYNDFGSSEKVLFKIPGLLIWRSRWSYKANEYTYKTHIELFGFKIYN